MIDEDDCGAIGGMKIGRGNRSTRRKAAPAPLCPPQIPDDQTLARTRAAAVGKTEIKIRHSQISYQKGITILSRFIRSELVTVITGLFYHP
jgi:hypothetical protein